MNPAPAKKNKRRELVFGLVFICLATVVTLALPILIVPVPPELWIVPAPFNAPMVGLVEFTSRVAP